MDHFSLICGSFLILKRQIQGLFWKPQLPAQSRPELTPLLFLLYFIINLIIYPRVGRREKNWRSKSRRYAHFAGTRGRKSSSVKKK